MKNIVIVGDTEFAEIASVYFAKDYGYKTVAFAVEREYLHRDNLIGIPEIAFEDMPSLYPPSEVAVFVATVYTQLNRLRERLYLTCKEQGYEILTYVSPHAFVWENVQLGENVFVFEDNVLQYNVKIGNNVILWSGNHIGHSALIEDNCFVSSHVVVSGYTHIGRNCFLGVNSCLGNNISFPAESVLAAGAVTTRTFEDKGGIYVGNPAKIIQKTAYELYGVEST